MAVKFEEGAYKTSPCPFRPAVSMRLPEKRLWHPTCVLMSSVEKR